MRRAGLVLALSLTAVAGAQAEENYKFNVQRLYTDCGAAHGSTESMACSQYIAGIGDLMVMNSALQEAARPEVWKSIAPLAICDAPTHGAMRQAFLTWAAKHREDWGLPRGIGLVKALRESWPCNAR